MTTMPALSSDLIREVRAGLFTKSVVSDTWKPLWTPLPHQVAPDWAWDLWLMMGGRGCVAPWTRIYDPVSQTHTEIAELARRGQPINVLGIGLDGAAVVQASAPFKKGMAPLWTYELDDGTEITTTDQHRFLTPTGWTEASAISVGSLVGCASDRLQSTLELDLSASLSSGRHCFGRHAGCFRHCSTCLRQYGRQPREAIIGERVCVPLRDDAHGRNPLSSQEGGLETSPASSHSCLESDRRSKSGSSPSVLLLEDEGCQAQPCAGELFLPSGQAAHRSHGCSYLEQPVVVERSRQSGRYVQSIVSDVARSSFASLAAQSLLRPIPDRLFASSHRTSGRLSEETLRSRKDVLPRLGRSCSFAFTDDTQWRRVIAIRFHGVSEFFDMHVPGVNSYLAEGVWNHNTGKTDGGAMWFNDHMMGPPCDNRVPGGHKAAIIGPTLGDAFQSCVEGPSGLKAHNPDVQSVTRKGGTYVIWPNGASAKLFGAFTPQDPERLRSGGNNCAYWAEELAAWVRLRQVWDQLQFGLRIGPHPRGVATTTPKARKLLKELIADETTGLTSAKTADNPHLPQRTRDKLVKKYKGTRLGAQELDGKLLEDVPGAVATLDEIAICMRELDQVPLLHKRITMIDPSQTNTETSDACGIAIGGRRGEEVWQLDDRSLKAEVSEWVDEAIKWSVYWECSEIWYESNGGSDTYKLVINDGIKRYNENLKKEWELEYAGVPAADRPVCPRVHFKVEGLPARMSKRDRAVALEMAIQQDRWHPVREFEDLFDQLTTWVPGESDDEEDEDSERSSTDSPNCMDAAVHLYRKLMGISTGKGRTGASQLQSAKLSV